MATLHSHPEQPHVDELVSFLGSGYRASDGQHWVKIESPSTRAFVSAGVDAGGGLRADWRIWESGTVKVAVVVRANRRREKTLATLTLEVLP